MQRKQVENPRTQTNQYLGSTLAEPLDLGHISSGVERPSIFAHLLHMAGNEDSPGNVTQPWSHTCKPHRAHRGHSNNTAEASMGSSLALGSPREGWEAPRAVIPLSACTAPSVEHL